MEDSTYTLAYIDQYLTGKLSEEEAAQLEKQMEEDPELQNSVKEVLRAKGTIYLAGREKWIEEMQKRFDDHLGSNRFRIGPLLVAAVLAFVVILSGLWWNQQKKMLSPTEIYAQVYSVPAAPEYKGEAQELDSLLALGYAQYNSQEYDPALQTFDLLLLRDDLPNKDEVVFFKSIALIESGREEEALMHLEEIRGDQYSESAKYYKALTLMARNKIAATRSILNELVAFEGTLKPRAEEVLEMLREE